MGRWNGEAVKFLMRTLDPEQWVKAAQDAGARYSVLVARHHDRFCLWPTDESDYSVKSCTWKNGKGDLARKLLGRAREAVYSFGVYLSPSMVS